MLIFIQQSIKPYKRPCQAHHKSQNNMQLPFSLLGALMLITFVNVIQRMPSSNGGETLGGGTHVICYHDILQASETPEALSHAWLELLENWDTLHHSCKVLAEDIMRERTTFFQQRGHAQTYLWRIPKTYCQLEAIRNGGRVFVPSRPVRPTA